MNYREHIEQDRRLVILRLLIESEGYRANAYLLHSALEGFGHAVSMDRVRTDLAWLDEQGLVAVEESTGVPIVTLSDRGLDVAEGRANHPGVKRPRPGA